MIRIMVSKNLKNWSSDNISSSMRLFLRPVHMSVMILLMFVAPMGSFTSSQKKMLVVLFTSRKRNSKVV